MKAQKMVTFVIFLSSNLAKTYGNEGTWWALNSNTEGRQKVARSEVFQK
jgi:hypothetical protein